MTAETVVRAHAVIRLGLRVSILDYAYVCIGEPYGQEIGWVTRREALKLRRTGAWLCITAPNGASYKDRPPQGKL